MPCAGKLKNWFLVCLLILCKRVFFRVGERADERAVKHTRTHVRTRARTYARSHEHASVCGDKNLILRDASYCS